MIVWGAKGLTIRSIRTDGKVPLRSVEYSSRIADCISLGGLKKKAPFHDSVGGERLNDPIDPYGLLVTLRSLEYSLRIVYCISLGGLKKKRRFMIVWGQKA